MVAQTISPPRTSSQVTKRSADDLDITPTKRRKLYHRHHITHYKQPVEADPTVHCQDERFFQSQLDRSLATVLCSAGFDKATPDAFESLRSSTQEFMLYFASRVRNAMLSSRRTRPLPQDFILALSQSTVTSSDLSPHLSVPIPPKLALPQVLGPPGGEVHPPVLDPILGNDLNGQEEHARRPYIAKTFPTLPSRHTWMTTEVFPAREVDPRKIREGATQEGILAEQALRKLAAAKKSNAPQRRGGEMTTRSRAESQKEKAWEAALASVSQSDQEEQRRFEERKLADEGGTGSLMEQPARHSLEPGDIEQGLFVNYDRKNWRKAPGTVIRA